MNAHRLDAFNGKRVLLLQGPVGPFFWRLAQDLRWAGAQVCKVNFNGGDCLFYPAGAVTFRGRMEEWPGFLERLVNERQIDLILLLGDCRPVHAMVKMIANRLAIEVGVFEEGYVRPDYITLEKQGANGYSTIPRTPIFHLNSPCPHSVAPREVGFSFFHTMLWAMLYYLASALLHPFFPHYRHHRPLTLVEALPWIRALWRKGYYWLKERGLARHLQSTWSGDFFLVPLQVHNDAQIHVHSTFGSVEAFIRHVVESFAQNAPPSSRLVIKHHPLDRGYREYGRLIRDTAGDFAVRDRVIAIHDLHLPTLLAHARGVVVVNSTVGFSSIHHGTPVKACGSAVYDMQGLTFQGPLDEFWQSANKAMIDRTLYRRFRNYLIANTQLNGSFYKRLDIPGSHAGLVWPLSSDNPDWPSSDSSGWGIGNSPAGHTE